MSFLDLKAALQTGGQHLGDLVWWALEDARIARSSLEIIWTGSGLAPELLPEPPTAEKALKAAVRESQTGRSDLLVRLGKEDEAELVFAVVRETRHPDGSVSFAQEARVNLDRRAEILTDDAPHHDVVIGIRAAFQKLRHEHTPDDIRRAMLRTLGSAAAVTLRDHGGVYWVPSPNAELLRKLQAAIEKIGNSKVWLLPVHRSVDSERTLGAAARGALEDELAVLKAEMQEFIANPPDRNATLVRRLDVFDGLKARAALYRDLLRVEFTDLEQQLNALATTVEDLLSKKSAA